MVEQNKDTHADFEDGIAADEELSIAAAFFDGLIDYAGLFPPADLPLDRVVNNYAAYLEGDDAWVLGRILIPVDRLDEFAALAPLPKSSQAAPWCVNTLVRPAGDQGLPDDLRTIAAFNEKHSHAENGWCVVDVVDLKAPDASQIDSALNIMPDDLMPFFELPVNTDIRGHVAALSGSVAAAKVRTGGVVPEAYPPPEAVADFILACVRADVPLKATAGLHHALPHRNKTVGADEFGLLNVFVGAVLTRACRLDQEELIEVLTERSETAFKFEEDVLRWREYEIGIQDIIHSRIEGAISFGSCEFKEPLEELRHLGILD